MIVANLPGGAASAAPASKLRRRSPRRRPSLRPRPELLEHRLTPSSAGPYYLHAELTADSPPLEAGFGRSVAVSQDGGTIAVAARYRVETSGDIGSGSVTVFKYHDRAWERDAVILSPAGVQEPWYTHAVAISADGDRLVTATAGFPASYGPLVLTVYDRSDAEWISTQTITIPDGGAFDDELTMSGDGRVIAVGTPYAETSETDRRGLVRIFEESGGVWTQTAELGAPNSDDFSRMGETVSLSGDGRTLAVGLPYPGDGPGAVDVYRDSGTGWRFTDRLRAPTASSFGFSAALSADGRHIVAQGVERAPDGQGQLGAVYAFTLDDSGWRPDGELPGLESLGSLPMALAMNADGTRAVLGVSVWGLRPGAAYVYARTGSTWDRVAEFADPEAFTGGEFGSAVAMGGPTVVIGDFLKRNGPEYGAAFVFRQPQGFEVTVDPVDQLGRPRTLVTFTAAATGAESISTRWQVSTDGGSTWADVPQASSPYLSFVPTLEDAGNRYRAVFTDGEGTSLVTRAATLTVAEAVPIVAIEAAQVRASFHDVITFNIRIFSDGTTPIVPAGGRVEVSVGDHPYKMRAWVFNGVATVTYPPDTFQPGFYQVTATYDGTDDPVFGAGSGKTTQTIEKALVVVQPPSFPTRLVAGRPFDLTALIAHVQPGLPSATAPTGYVIFYGLEAAGETPVRPRTDLHDAPSTATYSTTFSRPGNYAIVVHYPGDDWNAPATSAYAYVTVDPAPATIQLDSPDVRYVDYGEAVSYTVTVLADHARPAAGKVTLTTAGGLSREYTLDENGRANVSIQGLPAGANYVTFTYWDPVGRHASRQTIAAVGVFKAPTTVTLESSRPSSTVGEEVTFTATVAYASPAPTPEPGYVLFYVGVQLVAAVPVGADGRATLSSRDLVAGDYTLTAVYLESQNLQAGMSGRLSQRVSPPLRSATTTALASTANPSTPGQSLAFVAQVAGGPGGPRPTTGLVRFYLGLNPIAERPIDASGRATLDARFDAAGGYLITALYLGTDSFDASMSEHLGQVVAAPTPAMATARAASVSAATSTQSPAVANRPARWALRSMRLARLATRRPPALRMGR